jgi:hypothetical protein
MVRGEKKPDMVFITGGEPMLFPARVIELVTRLRRMWPGTFIGMYTATAYHIGDVLEVLRVLDGMTLTLHETYDVSSFTQLQKKLLEYKGWPPVWGKTMYLNVFGDIETAVPIDPRIWKRVKIVEWIPNCPLPPNERFERLPLLWRM